MYTTNELRWFYPGTIPEDIKAWFRQNYPIEQMRSPEKREDSYLYTPECDRLGIKLRQGRLEVKWRKAELGVLHFGEFVEGKAEKWSKWLCEDPTRESFQLAQVSDSSCWINVQKVRYSQAYRVLPNCSVQPVTTNETIDNGCHVEITQLIIQDNTWWSFALEAFGEDARLMDNLRATASWVFNTYQGAKLLAANSYGYPHYLALICQ